VGRKPGNARNGILTPQTKKCIILEVKTKGASIMRYVKFKVVSDDDFGGSGILPNIFKNWPNYSPAIAVSALAHDLLEHGCRETGMFHQEVAASGGYFFTRLLEGYVSNSLPMEVNAASGFAQSWWDSIVKEIPEAPKVIILDKSSHQEIEEFCQSMKPWLLKEWEDVSEEMYLIEDEGIPECPYLTIENWPKVIGWLKYGYARAKRRYNNNSWVAYQLYKNIEKVIQDNWSRLEEYTDMSVEFTLCLDIENGEASIKSKDLSWF
jgi:hypothetical protein